MKIFNSLINFINKFRNPDFEKEQEFDNSEFSQYLDGYDKNDENYENVKFAITLCNTAIKVARQRVFLLKKKKEYESILKGLEAYNKLNDEEIEELKELITQHSSLTKERNVLRYQISDFDKNLDKLIELEDEAEKAIYQMEDAEFQQRIFKQDIAILKAEKAEMEKERKNLIFGLDFIYRFSIFMVILFGAVVITLALLNVFKNQVVFFSLTILTILIICLVSIVYFFKRKINFEIKLNTKKQVKIVEILNKKSVMYAYYTNFLKYEYKKFQVKNSEALRARLNEYRHYKHVTNRYDSIRNIMIETQSRLEKFLRDKGIKDINASIEKFTRTIDIDDKIEYCNEINESYAQNEEKLAELDAQHEMIWDELIRLNVEDNSKDNIIESIIQNYLNEAGKLVFDVDKNDEV